MGYEPWATITLTLGEVARPGEYLTKAFELREHASERERLYITALYFQSLRGTGQGAQAHQQMMDNYPRDPNGYVGSAVSTATGEYQKADELVRQVHHLAPERVGLYEHLANVLLALQHLDEARDRP